MSQQIRSKNRNYGKFKGIALMAMALVINPAVGTVIDPSTKTFESPTRDLDFSSLSDNTQAKSAMEDMRASWGNFFQERTKPVFSNELTNVVKGSEN